MTAATAEPPATPPPRRPNWVKQMAAMVAGPVLIAAAAVAMVAWSWGKWGDPQIDFGRELYVPWQLSLGRHLYTDVAYFYGPLSPYVNRIWFAVLGVSYQSLVIGNLVVLAGIMALLYRLLTLAASRLAATVALLVFVLMFAFSQYVGIANYNYLTPYSHEVTHGLLLALVGIYALWWYARTGRLVPAAAAGLAFGAVFLTKHELFLALIATEGVAWALLLVLGRQPLRLRLAALGIFTVTALVPALLAFLFLWTQMPQAQAFRGMLGAYPFLFNSELAANQFFKTGTGFDDPARNLTLMFIWAGGCVAALVVPFAAALLLRWPGWWRWVAAAAVALLCGGVLWWFHNQIEWGYLPRPFALFLLIAAVILAARLWFCRSKPPDPEHRPQALLRLVLVVFALGMLAKMPLNTRIFHYGFVMAMPAALVLVVAIVDWLPAWIDRHGGFGCALRAGAIAMLVVVVVAHVQWTRRSFRTRDFALGSGSDRIMTDGRGQYIAAAIEMVNANVPSGGNTLCVLPEGTMVNYLTRHPSSVPYTSFLPTDLNMYGEDAMIADFNRRPPDFVLIDRTRDLREYGATAFGLDTGTGIATWMRGRYTVVGSVAAGHPPQPVLILLKHTER